MVNIQPPGVVKNQEKKAIEIVGRGLEPALYY